MDGHYGYTFRIDYTVAGQDGCWWAIGKHIPDRPGQRADEWDLTRRVVDSIVSSSGQDGLPDGPRPQDIAVVSFSFTEIEPADVSALPDTGQ